MEKEIAALRREYTLKKLDPQHVNTDPIAQFKVWLNEAIKSGIADATAMTLATVNPFGRPSSRVLLLKGIENDAFVFFTNYNSRKAKDMGNNPYVSMSFYWPQLERQVHIEGKVSKTSDQVSENYFLTRPIGSQIGAWASPQSTIIKDRSELENSIRNYENKFKTEKISRPPFWGGFALQPDRIEFWQGRESRLHDRICYILEKNTWNMVLLAP